MNEPQKRTPPVPAWWIAASHEMHDYRVNCKVELNLRDGESSLDHAKVTIPLTTFLTLIKKCA
jgi:hypothetical protein